MAFPSSPTNGQVANVGGITYIYNSTKGAWVRTPSTGANLTANSLSITSGATSTSTTTGALLVTGGAGIQGQLTAGQLNSSGNLIASTVNAAQLNTTGNVLATGGGLTSLTVNGTVTGVLNVTGNVLGANTTIRSLGVGTAASGTIGEIRATNNITAYFTSDARFKENIQEVDNALDKVCAIGSKTFDWSEEYIKAHGGTDGYFVQKSDFGVVAQDVQAVFPQAVRVRADGTLAVDYEKLATLAFGAIKELVKRIELLESK